MTKAREDTVEAAPHEEQEEAAPIGAQYVIYTKNPLYTGKVFGIPIVEGRGTLNDSMLDPKIGLNVEQIKAELEKRPGYTVKKVG